MGSLTEFLTARLDDDFHEAQQAREVFYDDGDDYGWEWQYTSASGYLTYYSPARVLAEVEAKRALVSLTETYLVFGDGGDADDAVFRLLALPYADHPDYDEAWRP